VLTAGIPDMGALLDSAGNKVRDGASAVGGAVEDLATGLRGLFTSDADTSDSSPR